MAAAWNRNTADDGASNLWLCSSGGLRVTLLVLRLRAGRYQRKCKHDGRNNGYDCFHASALHELWRIVRWRSGLVEHDVDLRRSNRVGPRANRRNAAPECPLWVISRHVQYNSACPLYPRKRTFDASIRSSRKLRDYQIWKKLFDEFNTGWPLGNNFVSCLEFTVATNTAPNISDFLFSDRFPPFRQRRSGITVWACL